MKADEIEKAHEDITAGQEAAALLEYAENRYIWRREEKLKRQIFDLLEAGDTLDPQAAVQGWLQLYESHRLLRGLLKMKKAGEAAGKSIAALHEQT